MGRNYIAFISYCHAPLDSVIAKQLHGLIEHYSVPRSLRSGKQRKLGLVFRDKEELAVSSDLSRDICRALDASTFLIVVCTPNTPGSVWVEREIRYFLRSHDRSQVLAVLAEGEPEQSFPKALTHMVCDDSGTEIETEPLAVDVRANSIRGAVRKLNAESKRLFAAILGCPYDALVHRKQRRMFRQAVVVAAFLAVGICFIAALLAKNPQIEQNSKMPEKENTFVRYQQAQQTSEDVAMSIGETAVIGTYEQSSNPRSEEEKTSVQDQQAQQETEGVKVSIGDIVTLGTYEQDNNLQNGAEDIQWIVLDQRDNRIMLISKYCLDSKPYHDTLEPITREYCSLREWLNTDFFNAALTKEEQDRIVAVTNENPEHERAKTSSGRSTIDRVFILSRQEAQELFTSFASRKGPLPTTQLPTVHM